MPQKFGQKLSKQHPACCWPRLLPTQPASISIPALNKKEKRRQIGQPGRAISSSLQDVWILHAVTSLLLLREKNPTLTQAKCKCYFDNTNFRLTVPICCITVEDPYCFMWKTLSPNLLKLKKKTFKMQEQL